MIQTVCDEEGKAQPVQLPFQLFFKSLSGMYLILNPDLTIVAANNAYLEETHKREEELVGNHLLDIFPQDPGTIKANPETSFEASFQQVFTWRKPHSMPVLAYHLPDLDQKGTLLERYWLITNIPILNEQGEVQYLIHQVENVTQKVRTERLLLETEATMAEKEARLRAMFEQTVVGIVLTDLDLQLTYANDHYCQILGRSREEVLSLNMRQITHPDDLDHNLEELRRAKEEGVPFVIEKRYFKADGSIVWIVNHVSLIRDQKGIPLYYMGVVEDITARKVTEHALRESEERYRLFVTASSDTLYKMSPDLRQMLNLQGLNFLADTNDPSHTWLESYIPEADRPKVALAIAQAIRTKRPFELEHRVLRADGTVGWTFSRAIPVLDKQGEVVEWFGATSDVTERKQAEEALRNSEARLAAVFGALPVGVGFIDPQGKLLLSNEEMQRFLPTSLMPSRDEERYGRWLAYHPDGSLVDRHDFPGARAMRGERVVPGIEMRYMADENNQIWTRVAAVPLRDQEGQVTGQVSVVTDITELKRTEEALREREERLQKAISVQTVGVIFFDLEGRINDANEAFQRMSGYSREDLLSGKVRWDEITPPEFMDVTLKSLNEFLTKWQNTPYEKQYIRPDGSRWWGLFSGKRLGENECVEFVLDITESKRAQEALQESEQRFRTMAEASGILIAHTDPAGNAVYFNQEWLKLTGRTMEDLIQYGWADFFHPEDRESFVKDYARSFEQRQVLKREFRLRNQQGDYRWQLAVVSPRLSPAGSFAGFISSCIDITELKQAEQKLQKLSEELATTNEELLAANEEIKASNEELSQANNQLMQSNQELDRINNDLDNFVYAASHDLKAPIHNIEGLMKVLVRSLPPNCTESERVQDSAKLINESVNRFKRTINHLTEVSKLQKEANQQAVSISVAQVIGEVALDLEPIIEASSARIEVEVNECPQVEFSQKNFRSIIYNLLSNAIKYRAAERTPVVKVTCQAQADYYVLSVEDNGLGIDLSEDKRVKLFAMFKRLHAHVEGSGIGLYMVKRIVDNAGGRIEVESKVGVGSTFRVYFKR